MKITSSLSASIIPSISTSITTPAAIPNGPTPLPLGKALPLFALPAAITALSFHAFRPWLENAGISPLESVLAAITVPTALLCAAALVVYHRFEGRPLNRAAFARRMRFPALGGRDLLQALILLAVLFAGYGLLALAGQALVNAGLVPLPGNLPALYDPRTPLTMEALHRAAGGSLSGRWDIVLLYAVMFFFNIVGEELWWRGIILPRQELAHGKWAWLLHGLLWDLFHLFKWWDLAGLLPVCLGISFAAQRLRTNWPGLIAHALFNIPPLLVVAALAAGWAG